MIKLESLFKNFSLNTPASYVIAEIGHNHKGSVEVAKNLFLSAKECGANAIKLQKRNNISLYTKDFYNRVYESENSYGSTYGKHREYLEFGKKEYKELLNYAKKINIEFLCTPFDFESLIFLEELNIKAYKIASADLVNLPLQTAIAKTKKPIFLSTGGGNFVDIDRAVKNISKINKKLSILHCTAAYPVELKDMHLNVIKVLKKKYPNNPIGLSDHENGIDAAPLGYMLGARIFEKHFTLDRSWKGTDHAFSLEPEGLRKLIRNLRRIPLILGSKNKKILPSEKMPLQKMYKSIVASRDLKKDTILKYADISFKSPGGGLKPYEYKKILSKKTKIEIKKDQLILFNKLK